MCIVGVSTKLFFGTDGIPPVISYSFYMIMGYVAAFGGTTFLRLLPKFGLRLLVAGLSLHPSLYLLNLLSPLPSATVPLRYPRPILISLPRLPHSFLFQTIINFYLQADSHIRLEFVSCSSTLSPSITQYGTSSWVQALSSTTSPSSPVPSLLLSTMFSNNEW